MIRTLSFRTAVVVVMGICCCSVGAAGQDQRAKPQDNITCAIEGQTYFPFGYYDPFNPADMDVVTQIAYRCWENDDRAIRSRRLNRPVQRKPKGQIQISLSSGSAGNFERTMRGLTDVVSYNVYLDAARTMVWGDGTRGTEVFSKAIDSGFGSPQSVAVFGRMPAGQSASGGAYADMLVITIDF